MHATAVEAVDGSRLVGADGSGADVDTLVPGTGFHVLDMPIAQCVFDADGAGLDDHWKLQLGWLLQLLPRQQRP
ncbi:hypothetical protein [Streptomyces adelaidensis]|uniref:hypothetical protein n=1 Tax=Streptomyces adelaidensis TaxID=2796465 RepID=UPI001F2BF954|nr:hypothetical protein [Streptomyces adelaidensis]